MFTSVKHDLTEWLAATDDRTKLQHSFIVLAIVLFVLSGLFGLLNHFLGDILLQMAYVALATFLVNALVWALLQAFVFSRLTAKPRRTTRK